MYIYFSMDVVNSLMQYVIMHRSLNTTLLNTVEVPWPLNYEKDQFSLAAYRELKSRHLLGECFFTSIGKEFH